MARSRMLALMVALMTAVLSAQQPSAPQGRGQGRGRGPVSAEPLVLDDHTGFESIFDGTMKGWDGDPAFWRAENGALVGETTAEKKLQENTFLIWRGGEPKDFELKVEFRMNATNSGIQIRSQHLPQGTVIPPPPNPVGEPRVMTIAGKWVMKGYQADIDFDNTYTGQIYEERGRGFLAMRGQTVYVPDGARPKVIGSLQRSADELKALIKQNDWNQVHLIARGNTIIQIVNGAVMSIVVDDDTKNRALGGLMGFQLHAGPPMKAEFRNVYLKKF
jgi:3-keto-disaccharide hydrolase